MTENPPFETAFDLLQQTVKRLESGELSLEQSLKFFEEGVRLSQICQNHLAVAEQRIEQLSKTSNENRIETQQFQPK